MKSLLLSCSINVARTYDDLTDLPDHMKDLLFDHILTLLKDGPVFTKLNDKIDISKLNKLLKDFMFSNEYNITFNNLNTNERQYLHIRCSQLRLFSRSYTTCSYSKILIITKNNSDYLKKILGGAIELS